MFDDTLRLAKHKARQSQPTKINTKDFEKSSQANGKRELRFIYVNVIRTADITAWRLAAARRHIIKNAPGMGYTDNRFFFFFFNFIIKIALIEEKRSKVENLKK